MLNTSLAGSLAYTMHPLRSLLAFQSGAADSSQMDHLVLFVGIAAISLAIVAIFFLIASIGAMIAYRQVSAEAAKLRQQTNELIAKSQSLVAEFGPQVRQIAAKVDTITLHVEQVAALVHAKADEISPTITAANQTVQQANETVRETIRTASATVQDANNKTRSQISRVDGMISSALDGVVRMGVAIEHGIARPGREVAGVIAGLKASFDVFATAAARAINSRPPTSRPTQPRTSPSAAPTPRSLPETPRPIYPVPAKSEGDF